MLFLSQSLKSASRITAHTQACTRLAPAIFLPPPLPLRPSHHSGTVIVCQVSREQNDNPMVVVMYVAGGVMISKMRAVSQFAPLTHTLNTLIPLRAFTLTSDILFYITSPPSFGGEAPTSNARGQGSTPGRFIPVSYSHMLVAALLDA